jgi:hypothetical protein
MTERTRVLIEIDEPMGPGVDFEPNVDGIGATACRARVRGPWLGLDRGHLVEADDGSGRQVPVLIALPASTFVGCRIEGELVGGLAAPAGTVLVARITGAAVPIEAFTEPRRVGSRRRVDGSTPRPPRVTPSGPAASFENAGRGNAWSAAGPGCPKGRRRRRRHASPRRTRSRSTR